MAFVQDAVIPFNTAEEIDILPNYIIRCHYEVVEFDVRAKPLPLRRRTDVLHRL